MDTVPILGAPNMYPSVAAQQYQTIGAPNLPAMGSNSPTGATLWPHGVGITNRSEGDDECTCPNRGSCHCCAYFCGLPLFFSDKNGDAVGKQSNLHWGWCCGWKMAEADVSGVPMSFEGEACGDGCCCCCCEPQVVVYKGYNFERKVGRAQRRFHIIPCCNETMAEVYNANNQLRFKRTQNVSCCKDSYRKGGCCSCWCCSCTDEFSYPVRDARSNNKVTVIRERSHRCCTFCYGYWTGIPRWGPGGMSDDDKMLLLALAFTKWWRSADDMQEAEELAEA